MDLLVPLTLVPGIALAEEQDAPSLTENLRAPLAFSPRTQMCAMYKTVQAKATPQE